MLVSASMATGRLILGRSRLNANAPIAMPVRKTTRTSVKT